MNSKKFYFAPPARVVVSVRGNSRPGTVHIVGKDSTGQHIEEPMQFVSVSVRSVFGSPCDWVYVSAKLYQEGIVHSADLEDAEIVVSGAQQEKLAIQPLQGEGFTSQQRAEIKQIVRDALSEHK